MSEQYREVTVTVKGGKDFNAPWIVFGGLPNEIRQQIVDTFQFDANAVEGLSLAELTVEASRTFQGFVNVQQQAGGKVLKKGTGKEGVRPNAPEATATDKAKAAPQAAEEPKGEATPQAEPETPAEPQEDPLLKQIAEAADMAAITTIWKANQKAFKERADVAEAVKKRRAEIGA